MLRYTRWLGSLALISLLTGCPSSNVRCRQGYQPVTGADPLRCELPDGGDGGDVGDDRPAPMCAPDAAPTSVMDPPGDGVDQNCDLVDGLASDTVFVAESGMDMPSAGGRPDAPVRSLPFALRRAQELGRSVILLQTGLYDTSRDMTDPALRFVRVARTTTIIGRYLPPGWIARDAAGASSRTTVRAPNVGIAVTAPRVTLVGLHVEALLPAMSEGASSYGLFAVDAPGLSVRDVVVRADNASSGRNGLVGAPGLEGARGGNALSNGSGGDGGRSCVGTTNSGGAGGAASAAVGDPPEAGAAGETFMGRPSGMGGPAGTMDSERGETGSLGTDGASGSQGANGTLGFWTRDGFVADVGVAGEAGMPGTGGGGGGGGFSSMARLGGGGGGGGGGGCGGGGGTGAQGGGGSVGVYLYGATTTATFVNCTITAGNGGAGGAGGPGGGVMVTDGGVPERSRGGAGGAGAPGRGSGDAGVPESGGGSGGPGGRGGTGGPGGPGLGGPSVGVARVAGARADFDAPTQMRINIGQVGANGAGRIDSPPQHHATEVVVMDNSDAGAPDGAAMTDASVD